MAKNIPKRIKLGIKKCIRVKKMKILMCYPQSYEWEETGRFIHEAFKRTGHEIKVFDDLWNKEAYGLWTMNKKLKHEIEKTKAEALFMLKSESIIPETLKEIKIPKILWHPDVRKQVQEWVVKKAKECDKFYTMSKGSIPEYKEKGISHAEYLPEACDPNYHFYTEEANEFYKSPINFIGTVKHDRIDMCKRIALEYPDKFKIWGNLPQMYGSDRIDNDTYQFLRKFYMKQSLWREYHSYASSDAISVTWDWCPEVELSYSARIYRVMASRGLYLCRYVEGMEKVFTKGAHCDWYYNLDEMMELINKYSDPVKRARVGIAAQTNVYNNHTFDNRIEVINKWLKKQE